MPWFIRTKASGKNQSPWISGTKAFGKTQDPWSCRSKASGKSQSLWNRGTKPFGKSQSPWNWRSKASGKSQKPCASILKSMYLSVLGRILWGNGYIWYRFIMRIPGMVYDWLWVHSKQSVWSIVNYIRCHSRILMDHRFGHHFFDNGISSHFGRHFPF